MKKTIYYLAAILVLASCSKDEETSPSNTTPPSDPIGLALESITLAGFNATNGSGDGWDGSGNPADPFAQVTRDGIEMFTSTPVASANNTASYEMNTAAAGTLPVAFEEGAEMEVQLWDNDGDPNSNPPDFMGKFSTDDALAFFYQGDHATEFTDVEVTGGNGVIFKLSGTFTYE